MSDEFYGFDDPDFRPKENRALIEEARSIGMLICPIPSQLEDGDAIERMPDDLFRAANVIGRLCDVIESPCLGCPRFTTELDEWRGSARAHEQQEAANLAGWQAALAENSKLYEKIAELERQRDAFMENSVKHYTAWTSVKQELAEADAVIFHFAESAGNDIDVPGCERAIARYLARRNTHKDDKP